MLEQAHLDILTDRLLRLATDPAKFESVKFGNFVALKDGEWEQIQENAVSILHSRTIV